MEKKKEEKYFHSINNYIIISENPFQIAFTQNKKIEIYEINITDLSFKKIKEIEIPDEILTIGKIIITNDIIVVGKTNKWLHHCLDTVYKHKKSHELIVATHFC